MCLYSSITMLDKIVMLQIKFPDHNCYLVLYKVAEQ